MKTFLSFLIALVIIWSMPKAFADLTPKYSTGQLTSNTVIKGSVTLFDVSMTPLTATGYVKIFDDNTGNENMSNQVVELSSGVQYYTVGVSPNKYCNSGLEIQVNNAQVIIYYR
jgi:hypothetical protein